jgi:hypothetical protein
MLLPLSTLFWVTLLFIKGRGSLYFSVKKNTEMQATLQILRDKIEMYPPLIYYHLFNCLILEIETDASIFLMCKNVI